MYTYIIDKLHKIRKVSYLRMSDIYIYIHISSIKYIKPGRSVT